MASNQKLEEMWASGPSPVSSNGCTAPPPPKPIPQYNHHLRNQ
eukprot:gene23407-9671_t